MIIPSNRGNKTGISERRQSDQTKLLKSEEETKSIFQDTICFHPEDIRAYMYLIRPVDENYKLDNTVSHELGYISIYWKNYFGDPGVLKIGPF